jgi:hypothetical protein
MIILEALALCGELFLNISLNVSVPTLYDTSHMNMIFVGKSGRGSENLALGHAFTI